MTGTEGGAGTGAGAGPRRVAGVAELALLLLRIPRTPIEDGGATAIFEAIAGIGQKVTADISARPVCELTHSERALLSVVFLADVHRREGILQCSAGIPVAHVSVLVVTSRVPAPARPALGITAAGQRCGCPGERCGCPGEMPLGHALRGLGVYREQLSVRVTPGLVDEAGNEIALRSTARLRTASGWPLALVTEDVHERFLLAYPPPWPLARVAR
jgi:hypothetical protein